MLVNLFVSVGRTGVLAASNLKSAQMGANCQRTLRAPVAIEGVGLHTGHPVRIVINPAEEGAGVSFRRIDEEAAGLIAASPDNVVQTFHGTMLSNAEGDSVATVEHLMAAFAITGVDNAQVDVDGPEVPIADGSALAFIEAFAGVGLKDQAALREDIVVFETVSVADGDRQISVEPSETNELEVLIDFDGCMIGRQMLRLRLDDDEAGERLAKSRTFCRLWEAEALRRAGLIRGGSLENSIVVDGERMLNGESLRDPQEFALHKALDLVGDLRLLGAPLRGRIRAVRPGHDLNVRFASAVAAARASAPAEKTAARAAL